MMHIEKMNPEKEKAVYYGTVKTVGLALVGLICAVLGLAFILEGRNGAGVSLQVLGAVLCIMSRLSYNKVQKLLKGIPMANLTLAALKEGDKFVTVDQIDQIRKDIKYIPSPYLYRCTVIDSSGEDVLCHVEGKEGLRAMSKQTIVARTS